MSSRVRRILFGAIVLAGCNKLQDSVGPSAADPVAGPTTVVAAAVPVEPQRVQWRFKLDGDYSLHSPGVGADGTIYVSMPNGKLYAVAPNGSLRWVFQAGLGGGVYGPVSVVADGTVYVAGLVAAASGAEGAIFAVTPAGTQAWRFSATGMAIIAGPNVGPDGNIYAVADFGGIGLFSLTPQGQLRFSRSGFSEYGPLGEEMAFGSGQVYFAFDMRGTGSAPSLFAYDFNGNKRFQVSAADGGRPTVAPNGNIVIPTFPTGVGLSLAAYTPTGSLAFSFYQWPGNTQENADVGRDNTAYTVRNLMTLFAINANGTERWRYLHSGIMFEPRVRPQNDLLFMGGRINYGQPGFFLGVATNGVPLWQVDLPDEPGFAPYGQLVPSTRPVFSPDGSTGYVVTDVAGDGASAKPYSFLYAISVGTGTAPPPPPPPPNNRPPTARANGPYGGSEGANVAFSSAGTSDPDGNAVSYLWDFGDGSKSTLANPTHAYADNGAFTVTLTVSDPAGAMGIASSTATIANVAPTASWTAPSSIVEGSTYVLALKNGTDPGSADVSTLQYRFACGQGAGWTPWSTISSATCSKIPDQLTSTVNLRGEIRDKDAGVRRYATPMAVANAQPVVQLAATTGTTIVVGSPLGVSGSFSDSGVNDMPWTYTFIWGDGTATTTGSRNVQGSGNPITANHTYAAPGTYNIRLRVTDKDGAFGVQRITVTVTP